ncbi:MAG: toll/interleukin-1 receptor domain-containing protein, partial [Proteobacteria bacterium]|nr:toll/interleukin-1 receptor domain-containing protein [Pseudomonadota bacterium]
MENIEVFISYAWEEKSHKIADSLDILLSEEKYKVTLDKKDLTYKDNIDHFEGRLGKGCYIITIISDKYLKSEHCMNEIVQIERRERVYDRIFPIILDDARGIYKPLNRLKYQTYWKDKIDEFKKEMMKHGIDGGLDGSTKELKKWQQIKLIFDQITALLASMNVLTLDEHLDNDFSELITKLKEQIEKDRVHNDYKEGQKDLIIKSLKAHIKSLKFTTDVFDKFSSIDDSSYDIFNLVVNLGVDELNADKVFFHIYSEEEASLVL